MEGKTIGIIVIVIALIAVGWFFLSAKPAQAPTTEQTPAATETTTTTTTTNTSTTTSATPSGVTVLYTSTGFSPKTVTVSVGTTVTFISQSPRMATGFTPFWIASDPHPTHQGYDGTTKDQHCATGYSGPAPFDECAAGTIFIFTFTKAGTFGYHDHANPTGKGIVIVTAPTPI